MSSHLHHYTLKLTGAEISSSQPTGAEISSSQLTGAEISSSQPTGAEISSSQQLFESDLQDFALKMRDLVLSSMPGGKRFLEYVKDNLRTTCKPYVFSVPVIFDLRCVLDHASTHIFKQKVMACAFHYIKQEVTIEVRFRVCGSNSSIELTLGRAPSESALLELASALGPLCRTITAHGPCDSSPKAPEVNTEYLSRALDVDEEDLRMMMES